MLFFRRWMSAQDVHRILRGIHFFFGLKLTYIYAGADLIFKLHLAVLSDGPNCFFFFWCIKERNNKFYTIGQLSIEAEMLFIMSKRKGRGPSMNNRFCFEIRTALIICIADCDNKRNATQHKNQIKRVCPAVPIGSVWLTDHRLR